MRRRRRRRRRLPRRRRGGGGGGTRGTGGTERRPAVRRSDWPTGRGYVPRDRAHTRRRTVHSRPFTRAHTPGVRGPHTHTRTRRAHVSSRARRKLSGFGVRSSDSAALYCSTRLRKRTAAAVVNYASTWPHTADGHRIVLSCISHSYRTVLSPRKIVRPTITARRDSDRTWNFFLFY